MNSHKQELKHKRNRTRHDFLLTFFSPEEKHQVKEVNGFVLVKQLNNEVNPPEWRVAIYQKEDYQKVEDFLKSGF